MLSFTEKSLSDKQLCLVTKIIGFNAQAESNTHRQTERLENVTEVQITFVRSGNLRTSVADRCINMRAHNEQSPKDRDTQLQMKTPISFF